MNNSTIANVTTASAKSPAVTLEDIVEALQEWRKNKTALSERIPNPIWDQVFLLCKTTSESKVRAAMGVSTKQFHQAKQKHTQRMQVADSQPEPTEDSEQIDFCEAMKPGVPLAYKPAQAFTTTTSIVEL